MNRVQEEGRGVVQLQPSFALTPCTDTSLRWGLCSPDGREWVGPLDGRGRLVEQFAQVPIDLFYVARLEGELA